MIDTHTYSNSGHFIFIYSPFSELEYVASFDGLCLFVPQRETDGGTLVCHTALPNNAAIFGLVSAACKVRTLGEDRVHVTAL